MTRNLIGCFSTSSGARQLIGCKADSGGGLQIRTNVSLIGAMDGVNTVFTTPDKFVHDGLNDEMVYLRGLRLRGGAVNDYTASESGGVGTGYDTITFARAPRPDDNVFVDYCIVPGGISGGGAGGITALTGDVEAGPGTGYQDSTLTTVGINRANNLGLVTLTADPTANQLRDNPAFRCSSALANGSLTLSAPTGAPDGRQITLVNDSGGTVQVNNIGSASSRVMSVGGGSTWVYSATENNWSCTSNV